MLNFLGNLFEKEYEYSHRSAISAYHNLVEGKPVGQHISVCNLMTGVFNKNPPKPNYSFIWDVEKVLKYIKTLPTDTELSDRTLLLLKLTSFLLLTSAGRCREICYLDTRYMVKTFSSYKVDKELEKRESSSVSGASSISSGQGFMCNNMS